jgi:signal transduction histidine kinase
MSKLRQPYFIYLISVSFLGLGLVTWGGFQVARIDHLLNFFLLLTLAALAEIAATSVQVTEGAGITYHVGPAVALASVPLAGPAGGAIIAAASSLSLWLIKPADKTTWKKSWTQLGFNTGMQCIALFVGGWVLLVSQNLLSTNEILKTTIPWLLAAVSFDQVNLWILIGILRLQHGKEIKPWEVWRENRWAASIASVAFGVGAGFLAFAIERFDWIGVVIFFLPLILSAYAFRLYVRQMKAHMDNLENIIAERTKALADLMKEKDQFLAVLTHDMKSPLTAINLYGSLIRDHPHLAAEKPNIAGVILRSEKTLTDIVNNILDLEKLQADGSMPLEKESVDLLHLIETTLEPLKTQAAQKQIDLQYDIGSEPLLIVVDQSQIQRVLQNLVTNAIKYTPQEGHICVQAYKQDQMVVTAVQDDGYGIPADELPHVFDRYRRVTKHERFAAGTGLGLAISKAIVEAHDGTISATSEENIGSTFTVELPL